MIFWRAAIFSTVFVVVSSANAEASNRRAAAESYTRAKEKVVAVEQQSRSVMGTLYMINERMKTMSRKRDNLNERMLGAESDVRQLAKSTAELENKIKDQRHGLAKRLRAIYMIGDEGLVRILFSSASAQDLDQSLKFLKLVSDRDYAMIKSYEKNLVTLNSKKERLKNQVKKLVAIKGSLKSQEDLLTREQKSKADLLARLGGKRSEALTELSMIRREVASDGDPGTGVFDVSFFEQKKNLRPPVSLAPSRRYGLIEDDTYGYRFRHKGWSYDLKSGTDVSSVFKGEVAFAGAIDGYGTTVVLDHGDHYYTVYSHLQNLLAREGDSVKTGATIAKTTDKLYFEIRHFSDSIDPEPWLKTK